MKDKLNLTKLMQQSGAKAYKYRGMIAAVVATCMIGYAAFLVAQVVNIKPDEIYAEEQRASLDKAKINFDKATITTINNLQQINPTTDLTNIGKNDPFSP